MPIGSDGGSGLQFNASLGSSARRVERTTMRGLAIGGASSDAGLSLSALKLRGDDITYGTIMPYQSGNEMMPAGRRAGDVIGADDEERVRHNTVSSMVGTGTAGGTSADGDGCANSAARGLDAHLTIRVESE